MHDYQTCQNKSDTYQKKKERKKTLKLLWEASGSEHKSNFHCYKHVTQRETS